MQVFSYSIVMIEGRSKDKKIEVVNCYLNIWFIIVKL